MQTLSLLVPILLFAFSSYLTPGPNNFLLMNSGLNFGLKKSLPHYLGICLGFPMMMFFVSLGLGSIFVKHTWIKEVLKIVGSLYMGYLAWLNLAKNKAIGKPSLIEAKPFGFWQACLFQWLNPKAWIMAVSSISMFTLSPNILHNAIYISIIFTLVGFPSAGVWLVFGTYLKKILKTPTHRKWFNSIMALMLIGSIALIYIE